MMGGSLYISLSSGWSWIKCHLLIKMFLRFGKAGWYVVTKGRIFFRTSLFFCKAVPSCSSEQSSPTYDALMPREFRFETWSFMREINGTITNTMTLHSSPNKRSKVYAASWKVRLFPAPDRIVCGLKSIFHRFRNRPHVGIWTAKSRFDALSTCEWQLSPQGSLGATLIGPSAPTRFWVGKIGANQVWKVLRPAPYEIRRRTFLKV